MLYQSFLGTDEMKKKYLLLIAISIFSLAACADKTDADTQTAVSYNKTDADTQDATEIYMTNDLVVYSGDYLDLPAGEYSLSDDKIKSKMENANKIYVMYNGKIVQQYDYSGNGINIKIDADGQYRVVASNGETEADVTEYLEGEVHVDNDIYK